MKKRILNRMQVFVSLLGLVFGTGVWGQSLEHTHTHTWTSDAVAGLSGLEVEDGGRMFHAVSDRGWYIKGKFERTGGAISDVRLTDYLPILGMDRLPVSARRVGDLSDAEGLAIAPDGTMWISFERWARVVRYSGPEDGGQLVRPHPSFKDYDDNQQLEAVALHPDGTLYAFAEAPLAEGFAIYRWRESAWDISGHVAKSNRYALVGADFDAAGRLYLLERRHFLGKWWQSRIRVLDVERPEDSIPLWSSRMGDFDNLEGIAAWQDGLITRLTVVADNNGFKPGQTEFLEFTLIAP